MKRKLRQKIKISEGDVIRVINDYLQIEKNQGKLMYIRNNSGAIPIEDDEHKRRYIRFGDKDSPDFLVFMEDDLATDTYYFQYMKTIAIEAKSDIGKQSKGQKKWQEDFEAMGGVYYIIRSYEDLVKVISGKIF